MEHLGDVAVAASANRENGAKASRSWWNTVKLMRTPRITLREGRRQRRNSSSLSRTVPAQHFVRTGTQN